MSVGKQDAFPWTIVDPITGDRTGSNGMTLRQYYIGQALVGLCSISTGDRSSLPERAIYIADAVIALLDKEIDLG